jgi:hypothetical protein
MTRSEWLCCEHVHYFCRALLHYCKNRSFSTSKRQVTAPCTLTQRHFVLTTASQNNTAISPLPISNPSTPIRDNPLLPSTCLPKATSTARRRWQTQSCSSNAPPTPRMSSPATAARAHSSLPTLTESWMWSCSGMEFRTQLSSCAFPP